MTRTPVLIACATVLAALGGAGIAMSQLDGALETGPELGAMVQPDGTAPLAPQLSSAPPSPVPQPVQQPVPQTTQNPNVSVLEQPFNSLTQPQPAVEGTASPQAAAPDIAVSASAPLPPVIRRLALQAQAETAQPYLPQTVAIRDEVEPGSDFDRFRARLRMAVRDRDADFLRQVAAEHVNLSFGGGVTLEKRLAEADGALWKQLERAIGGDCAADGNAPDSEYQACPAAFVASADHPEIDAYQVVFVDGTDVAVRQLPTVQSPVVARVSNSVLQALGLPWDESLSEAENQQLMTWHRASETAEGWKFVSLPDGRKGFVSSRYAYSPIGYRAIFHKNDAGRWEMSAFVVGD